MKRKILVCFFAFIMCLGLTGCGKTEENNKTVNYGTVEEITVFDIVDKFNVELSNNKANYYLNNDYMVAENGLYWYGIYEDVIAYVKPVEFSNDMNKDVAHTIAIRYDLGSKNEDMALDYVKYLIKANNKNITDSEITDLMTKAKEQAKDKKTANNGKGIFVGVLVTDEFTEYQIVRNYEK